MDGVDPEYNACGVGGSKRDSTDAVEAEAVDPDSLVPVIRVLSDFDWECLKFSELRRVSEGEPYFCDAVGVETWRTEVGETRVGAAAIGL